MPHLHEKLDFTADMFVVNGDAVLLRMHEKYRQWFPPGGRIEDGEDPSEAALRETAEEVGLKVTLAGEVGVAFGPHDREVMLPRFINRHRINDTHEHVSFVYFARSDTRETQQGETEVSDHLKWFTHAELDDPQYSVQERVKQYAKAALDALAS